MKYLTYHDQLKTEEWKCLRDEILKERNYQCEKCGCIDKPLHVHHKQYVKGRLAWQYHKDLLQVLCEDCHKEIHECKHCGLPNHKTYDCPDKLASHFSNCEMCQEYKGVNRPGRWLSKIKPEENFLISQEHKEFYFDQDFFHGYCEDYLCLKCSLELHELEY